MDLPRNWYPKLVKLVITKTEREPAGRLRPSMANHVPRKLVIIVTHPFFLLELYVFTLASYNRAGECHGSPKMITPVVNHV